MCAYARKQSDTNNVGCLMQEMFPIMAKPKALADALYMMISLD